MRLLRRVVIAVTFTLWALCTICWAGYLVLEHGFMSDTSCPLTQTSSNYGEASWSWFPPGVTCTWRDVSYNGSADVVVRQPPFSRVVSGVVLALWGSTLVATVGVLRRPLTPRPTIGMSSREVG